MASVFAQPPAHFEPGDNPPTAREERREAFTIYELACEKALLLRVLGPHARRVAQTFLPDPAAESEDAGPVKYYIL